MTKSKEEELKKERRQQQRAVSQLPASTHASNYVLQSTQYTKKEEIETQGEPVVVDLRHYIAQKAASRNSDIILAAAESLQDSRPSSTEYQTMFSSAITEKNQTDLIDKETFF